MGQPGLDGGIHPICATESCHSNHEAKVPKGLQVAVPSISHFSLTCPVDPIALLIQGPRCCFPKGSTVGSGGNFAGEGLGFTVCIQEWSMTALLRVICASFGLYPNIRFLKKKQYSFCKRKS